MLTYIKGDILDITSGIIVHGCNAQGVMGAGLAKSIVNKYPQVYKDYRRVYIRNGLLVGQVVYTQISNTLTIASAITQEYYGGKNVRWVNYDAVEACFYNIQHRARAMQKYIYLPRIGAGLGNGDWYELSQRILAGLQDYPATVVEL